jgi:hypothetical protein
MNSAVAELQVRHVQRAVGVEGQGRGRVEAGAENGAGERAGGGVQRHDAIVLEIGNEVLGGRQRSGDARERAEQQGAGSERAARGSTDHGGLISVGSGS